MSKVARRMFAVLVIASPMISLAACSSESTAPSAATSTVKPSVSAVCESQGSNSKC